MADKTTHAQRRRAEAQEAIRTKLRAGQFVRRLKEIVAKADGCEAAAVPALRLQADIYLKLLGKCLPDLKAIEHSGNIGHTYDSAVEALLNGRRTEAGDTASSGPSTH